MSNGVLHAPHHRLPRILMVRVGHWENWVDTVARYLARAGFPVRALALRHGSRGAAAVNADGGYERVEQTVPASGLGKAVDIFRTGRQLRRHLKQAEFDILYVLDSWTLPPLWVATAGAMRWPGARLVYHTFEWLEPGVHKGIHLRLERKACRAADLVVNIDRLKGRLQQSRYRLAQCPLWIRNNLSLTYEVPKPEPALRQQLLGGKMAPDALAVFTPSVASPERLTLETIQAFANLPERYRFAAIAGEGDYFARCRDEVRSLGLQDRAVFLPRMPFQRVMEYVACADLGTIFHDGRTSLGNYIPNPMRLSQFAACGVPFVASDFPTLEGEVYHYGLGLCCDALDPRAIATALRGLAEGSPSLEERRLHVRRQFECELNFESRAEHLGDALRRLGQGETISV